MSNFIHRHTDKFTFSMGKMCKKEFLNMVKTYAYDSISSPSFFSKLGSSCFSSNCFVKSIFESPVPWILIGPDDSIGESVV